MSRFAQLDPADYAVPEELADELMTPVLVVYLDHVRENLRRVIAHVGGVDRWRPHVKTSKIPAVFAEMARAGIRHFKCATTREAACLLEALAAEGVADADLLLAYPLVGPSLRRLGEVARAHPGARVSVLCEDQDAVDGIPAELTVFVDVNPGMHRTGIPVGRSDDILAVARAAGPRFRGVHFYDGHLHAGGPEQRRADVFACYEPLLDLLEELDRAGIPVGEVITSGTPSFLHALAHGPLRELDAVHRVSPGTVVYHDLRSEQENADLDLVPAALVLARVVSHPQDDRVTCDAGSKALAAEAGDPSAFVLGRPELVAETPSEEHLPLRVTSGTRPPRGTRLLLIPRHVCPTVNLAEEAVLVEGGAVVGMAEVAARAHERQTRR